MKIVLGDQEHGTDARANQDTRVVALEIVLLDSDRIAGTQLQSCSSIRPELIPADQDRFRRAANIETVCI
ncbi:MAG: hypothetical protein AAB229_06445, partial [Candidatus Hydrogenedentota bacterium]